MNLKGSAISLCVGAAVYLLVVRKLLIRGGGENSRYIDPIPDWCDLECRVYRPLLDFLAKTLLVAAVFVDKLGFRLLFKGLPALFLRWYQRVVEWRDRLDHVATDGNYVPRPSLEQVVSDQHFGRYADHPQTERGVMHSFAFGLLLTGLGLVFAILFLFLRNSL